MTVAAGTGHEGIATARAVIRKAIESYESGGAQVLDRERRARASVCGHRARGGISDDDDDRSGKESEEEKEKSIRSWVDSVVADGARPEKDSPEAVVGDVLAVECWWRVILAKRAKYAMQARARRRIARVHRIVIDKVHAWGGVEICALFYVRADEACRSCQSDTNVGVCVATALEGYHQIVSRLGGKRHSTPRRKRERSIETPSFGRALIAALPPRARKQTISAIKGLEEAGIKLANYGGDGADEDELVGRQHARSRSARLSVGGLGNR